MEKEIRYMVLAETSGEERYCTKVNLVGIFRAEETAKHVSANCKYPSWIRPVIVGKTYPMAEGMARKEGEIVLGSYFE